MEWEILKKLLEKKHGGKLVDFWSSMHCGDHCIVFNKVHCPVCGCLMHPHQVAFDMGTNEYGTIILKTGLLDICFGCGYSKWICSHLERGV